MTFGSILVGFAALALCLAASDAGSEVRKCRIPSSAPQNIEKVIALCQDEIKLAILSEALQAFNFTEISEHRAKRETFNEEERRIAGCLLHCVYRRMNALNEFGFPTVEGLVNLYGEGVDDRRYLLATLNSVTSCLADAEKKYVKIIESLEDVEKTCSVAYDIFNCVSDRIGDYCGQTP